MKIPRILIYIILIAVSLFIGMIIGYTPNDSLLGFFTFLLIGVWLSYTVEILIRIKRIREYRTTLNNSMLVFGNLFISGLYGIWGEFTPILLRRLFPSTSLQINLWITIFSLPYLVFGGFLLLFCITKYYTIYLGKSAYNARKFVVLVSVVFLGFDLVYILMRHEIIDVEVFDFSAVSGSLNVYIIIHMSIIVLFGLIGIFTRNRSMSAHNLDRLTDRMNDIDRRIHDADATSVAARRSEQRARDARRRQKEHRTQQKKREAQRRRRSSTPSVRTKSKSRTTNKSKSKSARKPSASKRSGSSLSKKVLLSIKPKSGTLSKEDFMCIFCFELPNPSDKGGIVICPNCRYPAHYHEFKEWIRNSKLCSRCDGVLSSNFIRNPKVIPVKTYLKAYKYFKKYF